MGYRPPRTDPRIREKVALRNLVSYRLGSVEKEGENSLFPLPPPPSVERDLELLCIWQQTFRGMNSFARLRASEWYKPDYVQAGRLAEKRGKVIRTQTGTELLIVWAGLCLPVDKFAEGPPSATLSSATAADHPPFKPDPKLTPVHLFVCAPPRHDADPTQAQLCLRLDHFSFCFELEGPRYVEVHPHLLEWLTMQNPRVLQGRVPEDNQCMVGGILLPVMPPSLFPRRNEFSKKVRWWPPPSRSFSPSPPLFSLGGGDRRKKQCHLHFDFGSPPRRKGGLDHLARQAHFSPSTCLYRLHLIFYHERRR